MTRLPSSRPNTLSTLTQPLSTITRLHAIVSCFVIVQCADFSRGAQPGIDSVQKVNVRGSEQALKSMMDFSHDGSAYEGCKQPDLGVDGSKVGVSCRERMPEGMVKVKDKRCAHESCSKRPAFGAEGSKVRVYCRQHTAEGMVNVKGKHCVHKDCRSRPASGAEGSKVGVFCRQHAAKGMAKVKGKPCAHEDCSKRPTFGAEGSKVGLYCRQHAADA